jgi:3-oxoacyl-[acyl-carrier protein] reductase
LSALFGELEPIRPEYRDRDARLALMDKQGMTALVTGSGRNIGRAIVLELASHGANVIVNARSNKGEADAVAKEAEDLGVRALVVMGEADDKAAVERMRTKSEETFSGVDIYVSNAARRLYKDFFTITDEDWDYYLDQQLTASWHLAKAFVPGMRDRGWGRVIHINGRTAGWAATAAFPTRWARGACAP